MNLEIFRTDAIYLKMLGINYESSDEDEAIPATKPDVSRGDVQTELDSY